MNKQRTIFNNSLWMGLDTVLAIMSSAVCSVLVARAMGPSQLGYYNYILWMATMTAQVGVVGAALATRKFAAEFRGRNDVAGARGVVQVTLRFQAAASAVLCLLGGVIAFTMTAPDHRIYATVALLSIGPSMMMSIYTAGLAAAENFASQVVASVVSGLINVAGVLATLIFHFGLVGLASALFASRLVDWLIRRRLYYRSFKNTCQPARRLSPEEKGRIVRFCASSTALLLLNIVVWDRSEVVFLKMFCDIKQIAFYTLAFNLVQQLVQLPRVFTTPASATLMVEYGRDENAAARLAGVTCRYLALIAFPALLGMAAISGPLVHLVYGGAFTPAGPVLGLAAAFAVARSLVTPAEQLLVANERQKLLLKWGLTCAAFNILLDVVLIRSHGAMGAAVANGVAQTATAIGIWVFAVKFCKAGFPFSFSAKVLFSSAAMAGSVILLSVVLSPLASLWIGVPAGAAILALLLRLSRAFDEADRARLYAMVRLLPGSQSSLAKMFINFMVPPAPARPVNPADSGATAAAGGA